MGERLSRILAFGVLACLGMYFILGAVGMSKRARLPVGLAFFGFGALYAAVEVGQKVATRYAGPRQPGGPEADYQDPGPTL